MKNVIAILLLLGSIGCDVSLTKKYANRSGYVEVDFPLEYRKSQWTLEIKDKNNQTVLLLTEGDAEGHKGSNPIRLPLASGKYTYALMRPPFFPNTGRFEMERGKTILVNGATWTTSDLQELGLEMGEVTETPGKSGGEEGVKSN